MLGKVLFFLLPVLLRATRLCEGDECDARYARIAAGDRTEAHTRPFQVALYLRVGTVGELGFCGGSLVHQEWVLTAAHCCYHGGTAVDHVQTIFCAHSLCNCYEYGRRIVNVEEIKFHPDFNPETFANDLALLRLPNVIQAIFGAHSLYDRYENGRRIVSVADIEVHPDYNPDTFANDLALLRLANVIQLTETVDIVRLPYLSSVSFNFAGQGGTASGWGIAANGVTFVSPTLREKLMTVMTDPLCNSYYFNELPPNTVCAFSSGAGTCKGDNGGPLTISVNSTLDEPETILIGVATFVSVEGCNDELPSVFTRTQRYLSWISEVTGIILD